MNGFQECSSDVCIKLLRQTNHRCAILKALWEHRDDFVEEAF